MANKRILLVDYDPKSLTYTRDLLQTSGFDVSTCADGVTALDYFRSLNPDLVLLSAMLPKMHGFEVCSNIRKLPKGAKTPVVIMTDVYKGKRYRLDAINKYGATEYIEKPIEDSSLLSILQNLTGKNGTQAQAAAVPSAVAEAERTVSISSEELMKAVNAAAADKTPQSKPAAPPAKKPERPRTKDDDEIDRKLEESLAGLSLDFGKGSLAKLKPKPKPVEAVKPAATAAPKPVEVPKPAPVAPIVKPPVVQAAPIQAAPVQTPTLAVPPKSPESPPRSIGASVDDNVIFTSEDLFTDVIASVEKELEHEKIITKSGVKEKQGATTNPQPVAPKPRQAPVEEAPAISFEEELEKRITSTLSGIVKDKDKVAVTKPETPTPKEEELPSPPTVQLTQDFVKDAISSLAVASGEGINFGQYLLLSKIAAGGMAELFKAKRKGVEGFEKILAIKRILPHMLDNEEFITMFIDEAKLAAQLTHQNICQIFDLGKIENSYYIAMEFVHGKDLRAVLRAARLQQKPMPLELSILVTSKICSALDYAHRKNDMNNQPLNLVHRDVSPQNILISYEGDVKLVDFGIAKAATKMHVTQHGALKGKLLYMSPEQAWGKSVDRRSDVFSVGGLLYEMLAGRPLFFEENDTEVSILDKVREGHITPIRTLIPDVPQELEKILAKALQKNPEDRYQSANDMQKDLDNLFYTEGYNATSASLAQFARSLFPEDLVQESSVRETIMLSKEASSSIKAQLADKTADRPAPEISKTIPPAPAPKVAKAPQSSPVSSNTQPSAAASSAKTRPLAEPIKNIEIPSPAKAEALPEIAVVSAPVSATPTTPEVSTSGFREISVPEILPPQSSGGSITKVLAGGLAMALIVGGIVYFLFRPKPAENKKTEQPKQTQQAQAQPKADPVTTEQKSTSVTPTVAVETEEQKQELLKRIEEEKKKIDALKAEAVKAEALKADELKRLEEQQKLDEQKKLEDQKREEAQKLEEQRLAEEQKKAEAEKAAEEQRLRDEAQVEQARLAQLQQEQQTPSQPSTSQPEPAQQLPPEPVVNEGDLVEISPDVTKPVLTKKVEPQYPPLARQRKIEGTVILQLLVNENGQVADVKVLRKAGGSTGLTESAITAVRQWAFQPAVKAGKRVKVQITYPIHFKLQN